MSRSCHMTGLDATEQGGQLNPCMAPATGSQAELVPGPWCWSSDGEAKGQGEVQMDRFPFPARSF